MKRKISLLVVLCGVLSANTALAGNVVDTDGDLVPDAFDVCLTIPDGPNDACNQADTNQDGYGNACDPDYDNNGATTTTDFNVFFQAFTGTPNPDADHDCNGATTTVDFTLYFTYFAAPTAPAGPSGLACAGTIPCLP